MKITKDVEYALICLTAINKEKKLYNAKQLAENNKIPYQLVSKILQKLSTVKLLESVQGAKGGYKLIKPFDEITLSEIFHALNHQTDLINCTSDKGCQRSDDCSIKDNMNVLQKVWNIFLNSFTLKDIEHLKTIDLNEVLTSTLKKVS